MLGSLQKLILMTEHNSYTEIHPNFLFEELVFMS